ncbi:MAG: head-tail connector protein [Thermoflexales bacterium]|nr:head-tail connector protein [Thermoflexales bacterium]
MPYATVAQLKEYLGISGSDDDALLGRLIEAAQAAIESRCGRRFEAVSASRQVPAAYWVGDMLFLSDDLRALTSVVSDTGESWSPAQFSYSPPTRVLHLRTGEPLPSPDARYFTVTGTWGYTAVAPADITQATIRLAGYYYRAKDAQAYDIVGMTETGTMRVQAELPRDVLQLVEPYVVRGYAWAL